MLRSGSHWDIAALRRTAERGGVIVLVPDGPVPAALAHLAGARAARHHVAPAAARATNGLRASEWLLLDDLNPAATARASVTVGGRSFPAVLDTPLGSGRVVLVTALDAWRYRADPEYSRFWRALAVELAAQQTERAERLRVIPSVVRPGAPLAIERAQVDAPSNRVDTLKAHVVTSDNSAEPVTLVRRDASTFVARTHAPMSEGVHRLRLSSSDGDGAAVAHFIVDRGAAPAHPDDRDAMRAIAAAHGGAFAEGVDVTPVAQALRGALAPRAARVQKRPMRWPGWSLVVATLLGAEWWTRRRNGLR